MTSIILVLEANLIEPFQSEKGGNAANPIGSKPEATRVDANMGF